MVGEYWVSFLFLIFVPGVPVLLPRTDKPVVPLVPEDMREHKVLL